MSQRHLITFFLISMVFLMSWQWLMNKIWPPKPRPAVEAKVPLPHPVLWANLPAAVPPTPGLSGVGAAVQLASDVGVLSNKLAAEPPKVVAKKSDEVPKPVVRKESKQVVIGDDTFNLKGSLTTRGAGVQSLFLTAFDEGNELGRPVEPRTMLELIPNAPTSPSNRLYHYANPNENRPERPEGDLGELEWEFKSSQNDADKDLHEVAFTCEVPGQRVRLTKTYSLHRGDYHLGLSVRMERIGDDAAPVKFRYQLAGAHGLPIEGKWYTTVYRNSLIGLEAYKGGGIWRDLQLSQKISFQGGGQEVLRPDDKFIRYAGVATQYFASMIVVDNEQEPGIRPNFLAWARPRPEGEPHPTKQFLDDITVRVISEPIDLKPGNSVTHKYLLYNGPVKVELLGHLAGGKAVSNALVDRYTDKLHLNTLTDYGSFGWWSDLIVFFTNIMHKLLWLIHQVVPWSYGVSIILLTVVVRCLLFPLSRRQATATAGMQEKMQKINQELAPEIKKLEEKFKNDPWQLRQAKHELYAKAGVNPMAMLSSCWLMFAQLPIFLGLYYALQESINFRLQSFLWMPNLAAPDMLVWWSEKIPFISDPAYLGTFFYLGPYFNLLPIVWVVLMLWQQKLMTPPPADDQQAMQQKMMKYMMIPFFFFFYKVPAGLCIYWIGSICWSLGERKFLPKKQPAGTVTAAADGKKGALANGAVGRTKTKGEAAARKESNGAVKKLSDWWSEVLKQARKK